MANEKRLIDAKPLMEDGWHLVQTGESNRFLASKSLADVPTVDAVEVVRCKDCKYGEYDYTEYFDYYECHYIGGDWNKGDHFCSHGERREKAE